MPEAHESSTGDAGTDTAPVAVVTGASSGIGLELARLLAADGADVVLVARGADRLDKLAQELQDVHDVEAVPVALDLTEPGAPEDLMEEVEWHGRHVETLINNAGFGTFGPFVDTPVEETLDLLRLNIGALTHLTALCLRGMVERGRGRILNVASTAAFQPGPLMATYYASKAYVLHFSEALDEELSETPVTVTTLCPGPTRTGFQESADMEQSGLVRRRKLMTAEEVAAAGYRAMLRGKRLEIPGIGNKLLAWSIRFSPRWLVPKVVEWIQKEQ